MTKFFKAALVSMAVIAGASAAQAGEGKTFDLDHFMQEIEAGTSLYRN